MSEGGAAHGGALREPAETGAAFDEADRAARPRAARLAVALWADITKGGQEGRGGGGAAPRPRPAAWAGCARLQERPGVGQPHRLCGPGGRAGGGPSADEAARCPGSAGGQGAGGPRAWEGPARTVTREVGAGL